MNKIKKLFLTIAILTSFYDNSQCMPFHIPDSDLLPFKSHLTEKFKIVSNEIKRCSASILLSFGQSSLAGKLDVESCDFYRKCDLILAHKKLEHLLSCDLCLKFVFLMIQGAFKDKKDISSELIVHKIEINENSTRNIFCHENKRSSMITIFNMLAVRWARFDFYCRENELLMQEYKALCSGQKRELSDAFYDAYKKASLYGFESICLIDQISGLDGISKIKPEDRFELMALLEKNTNPDVLASKKGYLKKDFEYFTQLIDRDKKKRKASLGFILNLFGDLKFEAVLEDLVLIW